MRSVGTTREEVACPAHLTLSTTARVLVDTVERLSTADTLERVTDVVTEAVRAATRLRRRHVRPARGRPVPLRRRGRDQPVVEGQPLPAHRPASAAGRCSTATTVVHPRHLPRRPDPPRRLPSDVRQEPGDGAGPRAPTRSAPSAPTGRRSTTPTPDEVRHARGHRQQRGRRHREPRAARRDRPPQRRARRPRRSAPTSSRRPSTPSPTTCAARSARSSATPSSLDDVVDDGPTSPTKAGSSRARSSSPGRRMADQIDTMLGALPHHQPPARARATST